MNSMLTKKDGDETEINIRGRRKMLAAGQGARGKRNNSGDGVSSR